MVWQYRSPIPVGRREYFIRSNDFYLALCGLEGGRDQHHVALIKDVFIKNRIRKGTGMTYVKPVQAVLNTVEEREQLYTVYNQVLNSEKLNYATEFVHCNTYFSLFLV
jgi:hypothetical protein